MKVQQQRLDHPVQVTAPGVRAEDGRRLDQIINGVMSNGTALRCDATLVTPNAPTATQRCTADPDACLVRRHRLCKNLSCLAAFVPSFCFALLCVRAWGMLHVAVPQAVASTAVGQARPQLSHVDIHEKVEKYPAGPTLERLFDTAAAESESVSIQSHHATAASPPSARCPSQCIGARQLAIDPSVFQICLFVACGLFAVVVLGRLTISC